MGPLTAGRTPRAHGNAREGAASSSLPLRARGLAYRYPSGRVGVEGASLDVERGEVVALLGSNGAGKSTLLRVLSTELRPSAGTLHLLGTSLHRGDPALRRRLGVARDEPVHVDRLSGLRNALLFARTAGLARAEARRRVEALLDAFGLAGDAGVPAGEYSYGMRRKLVLVQALAHEPELLFLDEPTLGLDPGGVTTLREALTARRAAGACVVLATNDVARAPSLATRVLFLQEGRIAGGGAPRELLASVGGSVLFELRLARPLARLPTAPPGASFHGAGAALTATAAGPGGKALLPELCRVLQEAGAEIREVRIRDVDLGDVFRELTGSHLPKPSPPPDDARDGGGRRARRQRPSRSLRP